MSWRSLLRSVGVASACSASSVHAQVFVQRPDVQQHGRGEPTPLIAPQSPAPSGPQFDIVSIRPSPGVSATSPPVERRDGGLRMTRVPAMLLLARAYPPAIPIQMIGLPEWARSEHYDVAATASLSHATPEDRAAMLRAMLGDRFKLIAHFEDREDPSTSSSSRDVMEGSERDSR